MGPSYFSTTKYALLMFVDIVDSSVHSSILGIENFARKVLAFQSLFCDLGERYFCDKPCFTERIESFCLVDARGDEGLVFLVDDGQSGADLVHRAVAFAL